MKKNLQNLPPFLVAIVVFFLCLLIVPSSLKYDPAWELQKISTHLEESTFLTLMEEFDADKLFIGIRSFYDLRGRAIDLIVDPVFKEDVSNDEKEINDFSNNFFWKLRYAALCVSYSAEEDTSSCGKFYYDEINVPTACGAPLRKIREILLSKFKFYLADPENLWDTYDNFKFYIKPIIVNNDYVKTKEDLLNSFSVVLTPEWQLLWGEFKQLELDWDDRGRYNKIKEQLGEMTPSLYLSKYASRRHDEGNEELIYMHLQIIEDAYKS